MIKINAFSRVLNQKVKTRCFLWISNTVVSNHFHSVKMLLFSSARWRDFDGMHKIVNYSAILATLPIIYNYMAE
jgi:hypothetical protein